MSGSEHSLNVPEQGTHAHRSRKTTVETESGDSVSVGDIIQFERFPKVCYRLQAFHDTATEDACFADFHVDPDYADSDEFVVGFDMAWETLADVLDAGRADIVAEA